MSGEAILVICAVCLSLLLMIYILAEAPGL